MAAVFGVNYGFGHDPVYRTNNANVSRFSWLATFADVYNAILLNEHPELRCYQTFETFVAPEFVHSFNIYIIVSVQ